MTIPKFRAWDVHEKKMFTNAQLIVWNGNVYANDNSELSVDNLKGWSIDEKYLMQSTDIFDENGKEIFEGDVLQMSDGELAKVVWNKELACWEARFLDEIVDLSEVADAKSNRSDCEVVGNIYENPELLGEIDE